MGIILLVSLYFLFFFWKRTSIYKDISQNLSFSSCYYIIFVFILIFFKSSLRSQKYSIRLISFFDHKVNINRDLHNFISLITYFPIVPSISIGSFIPLDLRRIWKGRYGYSTTESKVSMRYASSRTAVRSKVSLVSR